jgi:hypothetical protein
MNDDNYLDTSPSLLCQEKERASQQEGMDVGPNIP